MLSSDTKRKIDSARDILVGKVPDPKAQVEQITTALIYKFMDDMDKEAQEIGGKARFFTNGYEKYAWTKLTDPKLGGHERLNLYVEALTQLSVNPHIPQLFRDIFKDAFLPYRNPETLSLFIKEINGFSYVHSEDLGDAFEYLLSILGSQGDAGQFRTPRHIIDFIVAAVDPKKDDVICDPACGTAGFLISAYKHILNQHDGIDDPQNTEKPLTPDDKKQLMNHFIGYDISPDMVKLSKVNMYLHGFPEPKIYEYDTLSSEERWDDSFDVMLANPPFMTPKGGIKPHKRFSVQANRAEVLFVDYIKEHLRPNGRAGIIVPEGVIFQLSSAYVQLRRSLIDVGLYAIISLPVGVFNPYTKTTKTSILLINKKIQNGSDGVIFIKINNDGFDLGAERLPISENDIPNALDVLKAIKNNNLLAYKNTNIYYRFISVTEIYKRKSINFAFLNDIDESFNDKYKNVAIGNILKQRKNSIKVEDNQIYKQITVKMNGKGVVLRGVISGSKVKTKSQFIAQQGDFIMSKIDARNGAFGIVPKELDGAIVTQDFPLFTVNHSEMLPDFLTIMMQSPQFIDICKKTSLGTSNRKRIKVDQFLSSRIPMPSLLIQKELIKKLSKLYSKINKIESLISSYQKLINDEVLQIWNK